MHGTIGRKRQTRPPKLYDRDVPFVVQDQYTANAALQMDRAAVFALAKNHPDLVSPPSNFHSDEDRERQCYLIAVIERARIAGKERLANGRRLLDSQRERLRRRENALVNRGTPVRQIIETVAEAHNMTFADIVGRSRDPRVVMARHEAMYEARLLRSDLSLPTLAKEFRRDHSTLHLAIARWAKTHDLPDLVKSEKEIKAGYQVSRK